MKKAIFINRLPVLAILLLIFSSCEKDDEVYPAEVSAKTFQVTTWYYDSPYHYINLDVPALASNIDAASVMVYLSTDKGNTWTALPFTEYNNSGANYIMGFTVGSGEIEVNWVFDTSLSKGDNPNEYYNTTVEFKVVIVSSAAKLANPDLDMNDYDDVKETFDLED